MVAEGIHSLLDGSNASLVLLVQRLGRRPPSDRHPFGHGKEVYFWTTVVAMLACVLGGGFAVLEGVMALREREHQRVWIDFVVLGAAFVFAVGVVLGIEAYGLVVGEGARTSLLADARRIVDADEHIRAVEGLRSRQLGPDSVLLVLHARFADDLEAAELPRISRALEVRLRREHPSIRRVVFDFDQCPDSEVRVHRGP